VTPAVRVREEAAAADVSEESEAAARPGGLCSPQDRVDAFDQLARENGFVM
jgi:hypothetical protein